MARGPDLKVLRELVASVVVDLQSYTHRELGPHCEHLGMPVPDDGSKRERISQGLADLADTDLPMVAERALRQLQVPPATRNAIQDVLWTGHTTLDIPAKTRRGIARDLDLAEFIPYSGRFKALLARVDLGQRPA